MKYEILYALLLGFLLDCLLGDPQGFPHPIVAIGKLIAWLEKRLRRLFPGTKAGELAAGAVLWILTVGVSFLVPYGLLRLAGRVSPWLHLALQSVFCWQILAARSLQTESMKVYTALKTGTLADARRAVSMIVGRDTQQLDADAVARAAVETVAENCSDGVIAPMLFFALGGGPLAFVYKAVNTMDSMLGYKNDRYLYFGRVAARIDDVANYIPARITGIIFVVSAFILRLNTTNSWKMLRRDASKHPSPNGGWAEASVAGALEIRLGGYNFYFGRETFRAYMGEPLQEMGPQHIMTCIQMMYTATILFLLLAHVVIQLWDNFCMPFLGEQLVNSTCNLLIIRGTDNAVLFDWFTIFNPHPAAEADGVDRRKLWPQCAVFPAGRTGAGNLLWAGSF